MFVPRSHGNGNSYSAKIWASVYWNHFNRYGFRDYEPDLSKPIILFVGDSFTAGHGINHISDRYSNLVCTELNNFSCVSIGKEGLDSAAEFKTMIDFLNQTEIKPNKIVLQYFGNDIDGVAQAYGMSFSGFRTYQDLSKPAEFLVRGSFFANYLYWSFPHTDSTEYIKYINNAYSNPDVFREHSQSLQKFINYSKDNSIELLVVIFPFLQDVGLSSKSYTGKIENIFMEQGVPVLQVSELIRGPHARALVVNNNDPHPSEYVHKLVAEKLIDLFGK